MLMLPSACRAAKLSVAQGPVMNETPTQREVLTAYERRAKIIAKLHADATATANDRSARLTVSDENSTRRQMPLVWQFGAGIVLWIVAAGYLIAHSRW